MSLRFAFAFTLGSLSCTGSVQQGKGPLVDLTTYRDSFVVQVPSRAINQLAGNVDTSGFQLRPDPQSR